MPGWTELRGEDFFGLLNGYKLVVATALYGLLDRVINAPAVLDLREDSRLQQWWNFTRGDRGLLLPYAFTDADSEMSKIAEALKIQVEMLRSADTWESMVRDFGKVSHTSRVLYPPSPLIALSLNWKRDANVPDIYEALRRGAIERLDDYFESHELTTAYQFVWSRKDELESGIHWDLNNDPFSEVETHLNHLPFLLPRGSSRLKNWYIGIAAAMSICINQLFDVTRPRPATEELFDNFLNTPGSLKELLSEQLNGVFPSMEIGLKLPPNLSVAELVTVEKPELRISSEERLQTLVGNERGVIASTDPIGAFDFPMLMSGFTSKAGEGDLIEVLSIRHTASEDDPLTWYSLAVRVPKFGTITNFSKWWIFYKAYGTGMMRDSEVVLAERAVKEALSQYADKIHVFQLNDVSRTSLLGLFEPPIWSYVFGQAKEMAAVNSTLRGAIPELLAAALLANLGYQDIRISFEPRLAGVGELDVLGIKPTASGGHCLVVETKGESCTDRELVEETYKFGAKLGKLENVLPKLAEKVNYRGELNSISGIFISMARIDEWEGEQSAFKFWDYDLFLQELKSAGIPGRLTELLQSSFIVFEKSYDDASEEWFKANDSGDESSA